VRAEQKSQQERQAQLDRDRTDAETGSQAAAWEMGAAAVRQAAQEASQTLAASKDAEADFLKAELNKVQMHHLCVSL
jgi:hypothetical protein